MRASVMLEKSSDYKVLDLPTNAPREPEDGEEARGDKRYDKVLVLNKVTETGAPFIVVVGYFLGQVGSFDQSLLAEIETASTEDYARIKAAIRKNMASSAKTPITFW